MPQRAWRSARDLSAALAALAVVQLVASVAIAGGLSLGMMAAEVTLAAVLTGIAWLTHRRYQAALELSV